VLCASLPLTAQNDVDSLRYILDNYKSVDTTRVNLLNQLGYEYWIVDPVKSDEYGNQALTLSQRLDYKKGEAFANRVIGVAHWTRGNYELGLIALLRSLNQYKALGDRLGEANCNLNVGLIYSDQTNYDRALNYFMEATSIFESLNRSDRIATTYNKVGELFTYQRKYSQAYDYLIKALSIHQSNNFDYGIGESNNRLGQLFIQQGDFDRGLVYLRNSLEISEQINDQEGIVRDYENIGQAYLNNKDYRMAETYLKRGEQKAREFGSKRWLRDIYLDQKQLFESRGQLKEALRYADLYMAMKDSLFNEQMANRIAELEKRREIAVKERELELIKQERQLLEEKDELNNRLRAVLLVSIVLLLISAYLVINRQRLKIRKDQAIFESKEALSKAELANAELKQAELSQELEFRNKELTSYTINFIRKNEVMEELKTSIQSIKKAVDDETATRLTRLSKTVDNALDVDKDWEDFKLYFENVHTDFFKNLKQQFPELGNSELKLCALLKLNLNMKETAAIMGISPESVKTARYRLRKKLNLSKEDSLTDFVMSVS
jgi:tetratricopeptide (TPR) repeat protein